MKISSDILKAFLLSLFLIIVFSLYFVFIGIPLTHARTLTIQAEDLMEKGKYDEALSKAEEANKIQYTKDREELIKEIKDKSN